MCFENFWAGDIDRMRLQHVLIVDSENSMYSKNYVAVKGVWK